MNLCTSPTYCHFARYTESYVSKVDMLSVVPITTSILLVTTRSVSSCTAAAMAQICSVMWVIPGLFLGSFALRGYIKPGTFEVVHANDSMKCNFGGSEYPMYVFGESILFFYLPTLTCAVMYAIVGYYQAKYRVLGVGRLVRRGVWVTFFYCLCWIPFVVVTSLSNNNRLSNNTSLLSFTYVFYYFSVIVNPLTYIVTSQFFQVRLRNYISTKKEYSQVEHQAVKVPPAILEVGRNNESVIETAHSQELGDMSSDDELLG